VINSTQSKGAEPQVLDSSEDDGRCGGNRTTVGACPLSSTGAAPQRYIHAYANGSVLVIVTCG
jgi:hypothetical protein